jgi:hypothetical protein
MYEISHTAILKIPHHAFLFFRAVGAGVVMDIG